MSLLERIKKLELIRNKLDWNRISTDTALLLMAWEAGEPWESFSGKLSAQTIDALKLSAEFWQRMLDERKAEYEKTFGVGSYEMNRKSGTQ